METRDRHMTRVTQQDGNKDRKRVIEKAENQVGKRGQENQQRCVYSRERQRRRQRM